MCNVKKFVFSMISFQVLSFISCNTEINGNIWHLNYSFSTITTDDE